MKIDKDLNSLILMAPETQIDPSILEDVKEWHNEPTALDILFCLDKMVYYSLGSEFSMHLFEMLLQEAMNEENITLDTLKDKRDWKSPNFQREKI